MKLPQHSIQAIEDVTELLTAMRRKKVPFYLFLALCFNLVLAPVVYAASTNELSRSQAWSLGLLGLATLALSVYLFFVMFAPERF
jgi:prepilin signal peptidase PulO-like enzyme (type II secretory pathway)